jgi:pilus assembly protein CpaE
MKIKVLLISKLDSTISAMKNMIDDETIAVIGESSGGTAALDSIDNLSPNIIIMTLGAGDHDVLNLTERITLNKPRSQVILLCEYVDVDLLQSAMRAGARNVIQFPNSPKEFGEYIKKVYNDETTRMESMNAKQNLSWLSQVITVFGAKGGLGKTTLATNLAVKLAEKRKKVALIDLDLQFGDVHIFLDLEPTDTISELVQEYSVPNIDLVRSYMNVHSSGVHVLCAPKRPEYAELISPEKVQSILSLLRTYYDYVIIDTPPSFSDVTMTAIEASTVILFISGLDISVLKNSKTSISLLESLKQMDKIRLIINRAVNMSSIGISDVQKLINCPIWAKIPSDYKVAVTALNRGVPFVIGAPNCELSKSITAIADLLLMGNEGTETLSQTQKKRLGLLGSQKLEFPFRNRQ